jgi:hypothetical protein
LFLNLKCDQKLDHFLAKLAQSVNVKAPRLRQDLDLTDLEGNLKYLKGNRWRMASDILHPKEMYILVESKQCDSNGVLMPLGNRTDALYPAQHGQNVYFRITPLLINSPDVLTDKYLNSIFAKAFKHGKQSKAPVQNASFLTPGFSNKNKTQNTSSTSSAQLVHDNIQELIQERLENDQPAKAVDAQAPLAVDKQAKLTAYKKALVQQSVGVKKIK